MVRTIPEPQNETVSLQTNFSFADERRRRCFVTIISNRGSDFHFSLSQRIEIGNLMSVRTLRLTEAEVILVAGVRQARVSINSPTQYIRLGRSYASFGPYSLDILPEHMVVILRAIHDAYLPYGKIRLAMTSTWPKDSLENVMARLHQADCGEFLANVRAIGTTPQPATQPPTINSAM